MSAVTDAEQQHSRFKQCSRLYLIDLVYRKIENIHSIHVLFLSWNKRNLNYWKGCTPGSRSLVKNNDNNNGIFLEITKNGGCHQTQMAL